MLRVFASKTEKKTLTYLYSKETWSSGCITHFLWNRGYFNSSYVYRAEADRFCGREYFGGAKASMESLKNFQEGILETALHQRHTKKDAKINELMACVPKLPADWDKWIDGSVLKESRYIYYRRIKKKHINGFCTHCRSDVQLGYAKHGQKGKCPHCKSHITFKAEGRATKIYDCQYAAVVQRLHGSTDLVVRVFRIEREFLDHYRNPETRWFEQRRRFLFNDRSSATYVPRWQYEYKIRASEWRLFNQNQLYKQHLYVKGLEATIRNTSFEFSCIKQFAQKNQKYIGVFSYLLKYQRYPSIEYLQKMGFNTLVNEIVAGFDSESFGISLSASSPDRLFGVPNQLVSFFRKVDISHWSYAVAKLCYEKGKHFSKEDIAKASDVPLGYNSWKAMGKLLEITSLSRILNYFTYMDPDQYYAGGYLHTWLDYILEADELGYDLTKKSVLMPKDLLKAHDATSVIIKEKRNRENEEKIKNMSEEINQAYAYTSEELFIRGPMDADELIKEGAALQHCVGGYIRRIAKGETTVLFIRLKSRPDEPFYTVSINDNAKVSQVEGFARSRPTKEVRLFIEEWQTHILKKQTRAA